MRMLLVALLTLLVGAQPAFAQQDLGPDYVQTRFGRMGLEKSSDPKVREAGRHLIDGHADLDRRTIELARTLNVDLPTRPSEAQQGWLDEMAAARARSPEFDRVFANRLRAAHGVVHKFLATVRTGTRNTAIRDYAKVCTDTVLDHMTVLEAARPSWSAPRACVNARRTSRGW